MLGKYLTSQNSKTCTLVSQYLPGSGLGQYQLIDSQATFSIRTYIISSAMAASRAIIAMGGVGMVWVFPY